MAVTTNELDIDISAKSDKATASLDKLISKLNELNTALNNLNTAKISQIGANAKGVRFNTGGSSGGGNSSNATMSKSATLLDLLTKNTNRANSSMLSFRGTMFKLAATWGTFYAAMYPAIRLIKGLGKDVGSSMDYLETYNYFLVTMKKIGHDSGDEYAKNFWNQVTSLNEKMSGFKLGENGELFDTNEKSLTLDPELLMNFQARIGAVTNSVGLLGEASTSTQKALSMLSSDLSSLKNENIESVMNNLSSGLIGQSRALYKYGIDITNATLKQYAYEHGVTKAVSAMSQSEKMQLRVLAILDQSKVAWGDQANTISSVANQYRIMQQQLGNVARTMGNLFLPIVQKVLPYINAMLIALRKVFTLLGFKLYGDNWLSGLSDGVSEGNFSGLSDDVDDVTDSIDGATKAAKKFKQATMGWDELNIINPNTSSGSGSGSGGGGGFDLSDDIDKALEEYEKVWNEAFANMNNKAEEMANKFMSYVDANNWFGLGRWLSDGLANQLESIDWNRAYSGAKQFGTGLAQFLNGLISPRTFYDVGETIANSLNTVLYTSLSFAKAFDFANLGVSIGNGINGFFQNYDFSALAENFNTWVDGFETTLGAAIDTISWKDVFKGLYDFVSNLEIDTVGAIVGVLTIKKVGKVAIGEAIGTLISGKLKALLTGISIKELGINILKIAPSFAGTAAFDTVAFEIVGQLDIALSKLAPKLSHALGKLLQGAVEGGVAGSWVPGIGTIAGAIVGSLAEALNDFNPNIFKFEWTKYWWDECIKSFKRAFNSQDLIEFGGNIFEGIIEGFVTALTFITEPISQFFIGIGEALANVFDMHSPARNMYPFGENIFLGILEGFKSQFGEWTKAISDWYTNDVSPWFTADKWKSLGDGIKKGLSNKWSEFSSWWTNTGFYKWWNENVTPWFTTSKWEEISQGMPDGLTKKWGEFSDWWTNTGIPDWWDNSVVPIFSAENWTFEGIKKGLSTAFQNAVTAMKAIWNRFADWLNDALTIHIDSKTIGGFKLWDATDITLARLPKFNIPAYAIGGFPEDGLFMANHNELVGQFSNGQTAVANNMQIVDGIKSGVAQAVREEIGNYLREIADNTSDTATNTHEIARKPVSGGMSDRDVAKANLRGQRSLGMQLRLT